MNCELCGKETELYKAIVEGSELTVCRNCSSYGKVTGKVNASLNESRKPVKEEKAEELIESVMPGFGSIIKKKREALGLNQEDFAKAIAEKVSMVHKFETEALVPSLETARKLEKKLGIKLVAELREEPVQQQKSKEGLTLGDFIKIKKRE